MHEAPLLQLKAAPPVAHAQPAALLRHKQAQQQPQQAVGVQASLTSELEVWIDDAYYSFTSIDHAHQQVPLGRRSQKLYIQLLYLQLPVGGGINCALSSSLSTNPDPCVFR